MINRSVRAVIVSALVLPACLTAAEMGRRILDGYRVWSVTLVRNPGSMDLTWSNGRSTREVLRTIALDIEADAAWFYDRPQPIEGIEPEWAEKRRLAFDSALNYVWNDAPLNLLEIQAVIATHGRNRPAAPEDIFTFRTPDGGQYPRYRYHPGTLTGSGLSNQFGWRSRPITQEKPPNVIRIAALGDSTTDKYPDLVEHWLNLWAAGRKLGVRFEVINAARPATHALDAAAIVEFELGAFDPDYIIIYGFGNGIHVADALIELPPGLVRGEPASATAASAGNAGVVARMSTRVGAALEPWARWSAAAGFLRSRVMGLRGGTLSPEPPKPATQIAFPPDIDESSPDPVKIERHSPGGLMTLQVYLQGLNKMDVVAKHRDTRLLVTTFRLMAFDGMLLDTGDPDSVTGKFWWPYTYAQIHRLAAFYNRTLRAWAETKGHGIIPVNEQMPWQPELYGDAMHERPAGEALHAWIVLQQLMPRIREDLARHRLPRPARVHHEDVGPYWTIERTRAAAILDRVPAPPPAPPPSPPVAPPVEISDDIPGAYPLSTIALAYPKARIVPGDVPLITTPPEPTAYAATVSIASSASAGLTGRGWVAVRVKVRKGRIVVGVLNRSSEKFLSYNRLARMPDVQDVHLMVDDLSNIGSLVIANDQSGIMSRSVVELHSVVLKRFRK